MHLAGGRWVASLLVQMEIYKHRDNAVEGAPNDAMLPCTFSTQYAFVHVGLMETPHCHGSPMQPRLHIDMKPSFDHQEYLEREGDETLRQPRAPRTCRVDQGLWLPIA